MRCGLPVFGSCRHVISLRSSKRTARPLDLSSCFPNGHQLCWSLGPGNVTRALAVAGLATHTDLRPCRVELILGGVVVLVHVVVVAVGAHEIPVLRVAGPVQPRRDNRLSRSDTDGTSAGRPAQRVVYPCNRQRLQPAVRNSTRYCCSGSTPKVYFTSKSASLPSAPSVSTNTCRRFEKTRLDAGMLETCIGEVAEHGLFRGMMHGVLVLRPAAEVCFRPVAAGAGLAADECRDR